jgi:hypothetical protein
MRRVVPSGPRRKNGPCIGRRKGRSVGPFRFLLTLFLVFKRRLVCDAHVSPAVEDALTFPGAAVGPGASVGWADRCDEDANMSMVMVMMVRLRGLRSRESRETKGRGSTESSESFGRSSHGEPVKLLLPA